MRSVMDMHPRWWFLLWMATLFLIATCIVPFVDGVDNDYVEGFIFYMYTRLFYEQVSFNAPNEIATKSSQIKEIPLYAKWIRLAHPTYTEDSEDASLILSTLC